MDRKDRVIYFWFPLLGVLVFVITLVFATSEMRWIIARSFFFACIFAVVFYPFFRFMEWLTDRKEKSGPDRCWKCGQIIPEDKKSVIGNATPPGGVNENPT